MTSRSMKNEPEVRIDEKLIRIRLSSIQKLYDLISNVSISCEDCSWATKRVFEVMIMIAQMAKFDL